MGRTVEPFVGLRFGVEFLDVAWGEVWWEALIQQQSAASPRQGSDPDWFDQLTLQKRYLAT
eukprot:1403953-Amphidinium_carterae.2